MHATTEAKGWRTDPDWRLALFRGGMIFNMMEATKDWQSRLLWQEELSCELLEAWADIVIFTQKSITTQTKREESCLLCAQTLSMGMANPEAQFLDEIQAKVFLLVIHGHLCSFALRFLFLQTHATSYSFFSSFTVHCKGEMKKAWQKLYPLFLLFKKSIQKPPVWELSISCPETSMKLYVHESGFWSRLKYIFQRVNIINTLAFAHFDANIYKVYVTKTYIFLSRNDYWYCYFSGTLRTEGWWVNAAKP